MISIFQNGKFFVLLVNYENVLFLSPEQIRGTADVFYLRPIIGQNLENSIWFSNEPLSVTILDQILNRLKLLPDFSNQTKPVETHPSSTSTNSTTTSTNIS
jgi:hypothetical protein